MMLTIENVRYGQFGGHLAYPARAAFPLPAVIVVQEAWLDARINQGIPGLVEATGRYGKSFEHHVYEGARHVFFNDQRPSYDVRAARDAFVRTVSFLETNLV